MNFRQVLSLARLKLTCGRHLKHLYPEAGRVSADFSYSKLTDLRPLRGVPLHHLGLYGTGVTDWPELARLDFRTLNVGGTSFSDLTLLTGKPLTALELYQTPVASLQGVEAMPLNFLQIGATRIRDFSPVARLPLNTLMMLYCETDDLTFLAGLDLERFAFTFAPDTRGLEPLRRMAKLRWIHTTEYDHFSAEEFWHRMKHRLPLDEQRASYQT
ncbi:MAG: Serine/threonine-protein kinase PrkC [Verrucomicrobiota bacterium]|jgi:hypothetical protein